MRIETKFSLGDTVYKIWRTREDYYVACSFCTGTSEMIGADGSKRNCPECMHSDYHGYKGQIKRSKDLAWLITDILTIGQVRTKIDRDETEETYMCKETGIGSGSIHYVKDLFATREEAQAECDKRNQEGEV